MKPLKTFYILLWRSRRTKRFRLFVRDHLHVPCTSMVIIMFYTDFRFFWRNTLVCQQKVNGKSKKLPVRNNYSQISGRPRFYWVDWLNPWARFQWLCYRGVLESSCFCLCLVSKLVSSFTRLPGSLVHFSPTFEGFPKYPFSHLKRRVKRLTKTNTQRNKINLVLIESVNRNFNNCRTMEATGDRTWMVTKIDFDIIAILPDRLHH